MVFDRENNPLACLLFGSAAWKIAPRDNFIGWDATTRKANLYFLTNNMRFLILPWVKVPHLASHILGRVARRISSDWIERYNHPIYMLETFVKTTPTLDWRRLLSLYEKKNGYPLKPVNTKNSETKVPKGSICMIWGAPTKYLYFNDGKKRTQLRCEALIPFFCVGKALH